MLKNNGTKENRRTFPYQRFFSALTEPQPLTLLATPTLW